MLYLGCLFIFLIFFIIVNLKRYKAFFDDFKMLCFEVIISIFLLSLWFAYFLARSGCSWVLKFNMIPYVSCPNFTLTLFGGTLNKECVPKFWIFLVSEDWTKCIWNGVIVDPKNKCHWRHIFQIFLVMSFEGSLTGWCVHIHGCENILHVILCKIYMSRLRE